MHYKEKKTFYEDHALENKALSLDRFQINNHKK